MAATRIDCDIHPAVGGTRTTLLPYLDDHWKEQVVSRAIDGLDLTSYPPTMPLSRPARLAPGRGQARQRSRDGAARRVRPARRQPRHLQRALRRAGGVRSLYGGRLSARRSTTGSRPNGWRKDARLRASIVVPMQAPDLAVEEIERRAGDHRFVSVLVLAQGETPARAAALLAGLAGRREARACRSRSMPAASIASAPSSIGWPSYRYEYYLAEAQAFQAQILSLIYEGVFGKFPGLKVVLMESGVSWLPAFMWRANKTWRGVRVEVPWVEREPAAIIRDHVRVTMQPFDGPPDAAGVADVIDQIGSDRMFLFASDYPHWQFDGDDAMPPHLPAGIVARMCADNPLETFPRLKLAHDRSQEASHERRHRPPILDQERAAAKPAADHRLRRASEPACARDLDPFLPKRWQEHLKTYGDHLRTPYIGTTPYPRSSPLIARRDAWPPTGGPPGSDLAFMRKQHLDPLDIEFGILQVLDLFIFSQQNLEFGAAIQRAINEWQLAFWAHRDPRLKASIVVGQDDTQLAIAEIERCAKTRRLHPDQRLAARQRAARPPPLLADLRARAGARTCRSASMSAAMAATRRPAAAGRPIMSRSISERAYDGGEAHEPRARRRARAFPEARRSCSSKVGSAGFRRRPGGWTSISSASAARCRI